MNVLECRNLSKAYKKGNFVLSGMNLTIPAGKIVGLLGPNGCGKSTLIKLICGLLQPDQGEILVCDQPVGADTRALVSYLPERPYFDSWMKVHELLDFFVEFYPDFDRAKADTLLKDLGIDPTAKLKTLSKGTKEKVQLVLVMSRRARLYLLDEPIAGVDPAARDYILRTIVGNYNPDSTIVITTHLIADVEEILDDYYFMGFSGIIRQSGSVAEAREAAGKTLDAIFREVYRC
ncbi:MAG: ABC transporter ATP-binding protein [Clostridia bacterium]|nr:ABC transporter ATP-binding protein [Clostridia bacterium]